MISIHDQVTLCSNWTSDLPCIIEGSSDLQVEVSDDRDTLLSAEAFILSWMPAVTVCIGA